MLARFSRLTGWLLGAALALAACGLPTGRQRIARDFAAVPPQALYAHLLGDPRLLVLATQPPRLVGALQHPRFRAASFITADSQGHLLVALDADAEHNYREVWKVDPSSGRLLARIPLPGWAPTRLACSPHDRVVVGHSLEKPSGTYDLDILAAAEARVLKTLEVPGYTTDIVFAQDIAYIALTAANAPSQSGVLVYDTRALQQKAYFTLPQPPGEPPLAPTWLAVDPEAHVLYAVLFQYREEGPCQQRGRLAAVDLDTGQWTLLMDLEDVGPVQVLSSGDLLIGEACPWGTGRLLRVDAAQGRIWAQETLHPGIAVLFPLGADRFAVGIEPDPAFTPQGTPPLIFFDATQWARLGEVPIPYAFGVHALAGPSPREATTKP